MRRFGIIMGLGLTLAAPLPVGASEMVALPSGQEVTLYEVIVEAGEKGDIYHLRFLKPSIADTDLLAELQANEADMAYLCQVYALPEIAMAGGLAEKIVVSFSDKPSPFGLANPEVTQIYESYRVENKTCQWEEF